MRSKRKILAAAATVLVCLFILVCGCASTQNVRKPPAPQPAPAQAVAGCMPYLRLTHAPSTDTLPIFIPDGQPLACVDAQLYPGIQELEGTVFLPQTLVTVVFAIDRSQTDLRPDSWHSLLNAGLSVGFPAGSDTAFSTVVQRLALAALAYGLDGPAYSGQAAFAQLEKLQSEGLLQTGSTDSPVTICLDQQAMAWMAQGRNLEIIIPRDGTLSFACGLFGKAGLTGPTDETLLESGLRLLDGRCQNPYAPPPQAYAPAVRATDFEKLMAETDTFTRDYRRTVLHIRKYTSADTQEHILFPVLLSFLMIGWTASALYRSSRADLRRCIWLISGQTIAWLLLTSLKYSLWTSSLLARLLWYSYYLFVLGLPLVLLSVALLADRDPHTQGLPRWFWLIAAAYPVLLLLIFTNDWHQLVFRFDLIGDWSHSYVYGAGYYLVFLYAISCFLLSIGIMIVKSKNSPKQYAWVSPILFAAALIAYNVAYICGVPLARDCSLPQVFCIFSILFTESVLHAGLIPSNNKYKPLFTASALHMQLLDLHGHTVLASAGAPSLTRLQRMSLLAEPERPLQKDENTLLHSRRIHGGLAVWEQDCTSLHALQKRLQLSIDKNREVNALLCKESQILHQKLASEVNTQLFQALESDIDDKVQELAQAVRTQPDGPQRETRLAYITLLLCHIKRRCNLFFLSQEGQSISGNELCVYLDELSEFAAYAGIHALTRSGLSGSVPLCIGTLCYDFYFSLLSWAIQSSHATLLGQIEEKDGSILFGVLASESPADVVFSDAFRAHAKAAGARVSHHALEESEGIYLVFPQKGGRPS